MGRPRKKLPELVEHNGRARVWWGGRWHYLGATGSDQAKRRHAALLARLAIDPTAAIQSSGDYLLAELMADYGEWAAIEFADSPKRVARIDRAADLLEALYADTALCDFGPVKLEVWQRWMAGAKDGQPNLNVTSIRYMVREVLEAIRWAIRTERIEPSGCKYDALKAVPHLSRKHARPPRKVRPVAPKLVAATLPHLRPPVRAMVLLQQMTGARPGELFKMRPRDVHKSGLVTLSSGLVVDLAAWGGVWVYVPAADTPEGLAHKTAHRDIPRDVLIGPNAQKVLSPFLDRPDDAYCFSPRESLAHLRSEQTARRKGGGNKKPKAAKPRRKPGEKYTAGSYRRAIHYGCDKAQVARWFPYQLRHLAATEIQTEAGLDAVRAILGHVDPRTSTRYAARDFELAARAIAKLG